MNDVRCLGVPSDKKNAELNNGPVHGSAVHLQKLLVHGGVFIFGKVCLPRDRLHGPVDSIHFSLHVTQMVIYVGVL